MAVKTLAVATPFTSVVAVEVLELVEAKTPLAPVPGATKLTVKPEMGTLFASVTVTFKLVGNAVFTVADWLLPASIVTVDGTCITDAVSNAVAPFEELVCVKSPPPHTVTLLVTDFAESVGTLTASLIRLNSPPAPATTWDEVQVTVVEPLQAQPVVPAVLARV